MSTSAADPDPDPDAPERPAELDPSAPVEDLPGVGPARARALKEARDQLHARAGEKDAQMERERAEKRTMALAHKERQGLQIGRAHV